MRQIATLPPPIFSREHQAVSDETTIAYPWQRLLSYVCLALIFCHSTAALQAQSTTPSFVSGTPQDEADIRKVLSQPDRHASAQAPDMDWENAFGTRYANTKKMTAFYHANVDPLQAQSTQTLLEIRVKFIADNVAIADVYNHRVGQIDQATGRVGADRWTRSTDLLKKENGAWVIIAHRVADLRSPWYKHYDTMPAPFPVPAATLLLYVGHYQFPSGPPVENVSMAGDHLVLRSTGRSRTMVPTSTREFLAFDPDDLADYLVVTFGKNASGNTTLSIAQAGDTISEAGVRID